MFSATRAPTVTRRATSLTVCRPKSGSPLLPSPGQWSPCHLRTAAPRARSAGVPEWRGSRSDHDTGPAGIPVEPAGGLLHNNATFDTRAAGDINVSPDGPQPTCYVSSCQDDVAVNVLDPSSNVRVVLQMHPAVHSRDSPGNVCSSA